jgi:uncharacterized protein YggE
MLRTTRIRLAIILCPLLAAATPAIAADPPKAEGREIVAHATATKFVEPDGARLTFLLTAGETADKSAREAAEKQVKKLQDVLASLPLDDVKVEVKVSPASVSGMATPADPPAIRTVTGKRVQHVFQVTVREKNLSKLRNAVVRLAEAAVENGGTGVLADSPFRPFRLPRAAVAAVREEEPVNGPNIEWVISDPAKARRDAIRQATREAIADAEAAAADGKVTVQKVEVNTREDGFVTIRDGSVLSASGILQIPIRVQVTVTCKQ